MRLIDADALREKVRDEGVASVFRNIQFAPTIDAVPVRHGKWEWKKYPNGHETWECSVCRSPMITRFWYCPNCGAKMDAERKEE